MYMKIKEHVIAIVIITAIVSVGGCISDDSKEFKTIELESEKESNQTVSEPVFDKEKENITKEDTTKDTKKDIEFVLDEENLTENKSGSKEKPYGEDAIYISYDPVIIYGSLPKSQEIEYIKEDKVVFKFLYYSRCPICKRALPSVPEIKKEFGERIIVEEMDVYSKEAEEWKGAAEEYINADRFPFTLAIGMNSLIDNEIRMEFVSYTESFNAGTYEQWKRNICGQFKDKPEACK